MASSTSNAMLFIYVFAFCVGMIQITLNSLLMTKVHSVIQSRSLSFNIIFFFFVMINFLLFFCRQFAQLSVINETLIIIFDLLYAMLVAAWAFYCSSLTGKKPGRFFKYAIITICSIYFLCWLITELFFMEKNQIDFTLAGKMLITIGETAMLIMSLEITWYSYMHIKGKRNFALCLNLIMSVYFIYYFLYDIDCVFRSIGPRNWPGYPFDLLLPVYIIFNIICIISLYLTFWKRKSLDSMETVEEFIEMLDPEQKLTAREKEVLTLMIQGKTNNQIAEELVISTFTVKRHVNNIFKKTDLNSRAELDALLR